MPADLSIDIVEAPPKTVLVRNAYLTEGTADLERRAASGAVYDHRNRLVAESVRFGGYRGDLFRSQNDPVLQARDPAALRLRGRSIYLGHYMPHYGHFLTEGLSCFWGLEVAETWDHVVLHPFAWGVDPTAFYARAFAAYGVRADQVELASRPLVCDELLVPERLLQLNRSVNLELRRVFARLKARCSSPTTEAVPRLYLSREHVHKKRKITNETAVREQFERWGYVTIYPEELSFDVQIALFSRAQVIAGFAGSALHNVVFCQPDALLLEIGDVRCPNQSHPTQRLCSALGGVRHVHIPFRGEVIDGRMRSANFDVAWLADQVRTRVPDAIACEVPA